MDLIIDSTINANKTVNNIQDALWRGNITEKEKKELQERYQIEYSEALKNIQSYMNSSSCR